jgi:hypothetical protein
MLPAPLCRSSTRRRPTEQGETRRERESDWTLSGRCWAPTGTPVDRAQFRARGGGCAVAPVMPGPRGLGCLRYSPGLHTVLRAVPLSVLQRLLSFRVLVERDPRRSTTVLSLAVLLKMLLPLLPGPAAIPKPKLLEESLLATVFPVLPSPDSLPAGSESVGARHVLRDRVADGGYKLDSEAAVFVLQELRVDGRAQIQSSYRLITPEVCATSEKVGRTEHYANRTDHELVAPTLSV